MYQSFYAVCTARDGFHYRIDCKESGPVFNWYRNLRALGAVRVFGVDSQDRSILLGEGQE
jgi:hypothetical protein